MNFKAKYEIVAVYKNGEVWTWETEAYTETQAVESFKYTLNQMGIEWTSYGVSRVA